jgi:hypothetical protein
VDTGGYPNIIMELVRPGYPDENIRQMLGGNGLPVMADVGAVAADLSEEARERFGPPAGTREGRLSTTTQEE